MKITLINAGKRYSREWIFRNFNYKFSAGKKYAVTGANGSGKSTLLQVLSGNISLIEGDIKHYVDGRFVEAESIYKYTSIAAPYFELIEEMTAKEFLIFHSKFKNYIQNISVEDMLAQAGLANALNKQIRFFSSGMKQRLKLVQAVFSDVAVVLLDEPCTNLDASGIQLYYDWINTYCSNRLVVIASNDENEYRFCDEEINLPLMQMQSFAPNI